jgi:methylglutaconyl-CoA hydratase
LSEAKLGILPAVIGPYVYRKIGSSNFRRLSMMASKIDSNEAKVIGLINTIADSPDEFSSPLEEIISEVLSTGPMAVAEAKKLTLTFDRWNGSDDELRQWTLDKTSQMRGSEEGQEGLSSFLERRKPNWSPK